MSSSLRSRRMARNHSRMARPARLNLVALMDIFTILVLFLMVNNGDVEVLQADRNVTLPESVSEQRPEATLTIKVTRSEILMGGHSISSIDEALAVRGEVLPALGQALREQQMQAGDTTPAQEQRGRAIVIMGDHEMPYSLLKRILATCAETDYRNISLAVNSKPAAPGALAKGAEPQLASLGATP